MKDFTVVFFVGFGLVSAVIGAMHLMRRKVPAPLTEQQQNTMIGPFSFVATLYAFLLGFVVVTLWHNFNEASRLAAAEAEAVTALYRLSEGIPGGKTLQRTLIDYVRSVREDEWPEMAEERLSDTTEAIYERIWRDQQNLIPESTRQQALLSEFAHQLSELSRLRRERILHAVGGMPDLMWWTLFAGCIPLLVGLYFLSVGNRRAQIAVDGIVFGMLLLMLYLAVEFNGPFRGNVKVSPKAFELTETRLTRWK
jgi:hypothetical protein